MRDLILVVGSLNMDFVVSVDQLPAPGATVSGHSFQTIPGGKGANQACAAARFSGGRAAMIGRVGSDVFGEQLRASLVGAGCDVSAVMQTPGPSGVALIFVAKGGLNQIVVAPGANGEVSPADVEASEHLFERARIVLMQLETPLDTIEAAVRMAAKHGVETMLDPAPARDLSAGLLAGIDWLTPNETEACVLTGRAPKQLTPADASVLAPVLLALGPRRVVVKLGQHGSVYATGTRATHFPAPRVAAVDSTAAGDTFNAALAVALSENRTVEAAIAFASAAAALSVTRYGAQASIPSRSEVDQFVGESAAAG